MIRRFLLVNLIFSSLNILGVQTETKAQTEQQFLEVNPENVTQLHETLNKAGLQTTVLQDLVCDYLIEYKCIKSLRKTHYINNGNIEGVLPNDNLILRWDSSVCIYDSLGNCPNCFESNVYNTFSCFFENNTLAVGGNDNEIYIYDLSTAKCLNTLEGREFSAHPADCVKKLAGHTSFLRPMCYLGGNKLASSSYDKTIKIWDIVSGSCLKTINLADEVGSLCLIPNNVLVSICFNGAIQMWDIDPGKCLQTLDFKSDSYCVFNGSNKLAFTSNNTILVWDIESQEYFKLEGHLEFINAMCYLSNKLLVSGSADGKIRIWDLNSKKCLQEFVGHDDCPIKSLFAMSNGKFVSCACTHYKILKIKIWEPRFDLTIEKVIK